MTYASRQVRWKPGQDLRPLARKPVLRSKRTRDSLERGVFWSDSCAFEVTSVCNLRCRVCPQGARNGFRGTDRAAKYTPIERLKRWQDDAAVLGMRSITYNLYNEPFLYPHLREAVEHAVTLGITPVIHTNIAALEEWIYDTPAIITGTFYKGGSKQASNPRYEQAVREKLPRLLGFVEERSRTENHAYLRSGVRTLYGVEEGLPVGQLRPWAGELLNEALEETKASFTPEQLIDLEYYLTAPNRMLAYECSQAGLLEVVVTGNGRLQLCCADTLEATSYAEIGNEDSLYDLVTGKGFDAWMNLQQATPKACADCLQADLQYTVDLSEHIAALIEERDASDE